MADDILQILRAKKADALPESQTKQTAPGSGGCEVGRQIEPPLPRARVFSTRPYLLQNERNNLALWLWACRASNVASTPMLSDPVKQRIASFLAQYDTSHLIRLMGTASNSTSNQSETDSSHNVLSHIQHPVAASDHSWSQLAGWGDMTSPYKWEGLFWNELDRVQEVALPAMNLCGRIPRGLSMFRHMVTLNLGDFQGGNSLTGSIPTEIGQLVNLEALLLYDNELRGRIPTELGQLKKLRNLSLHVNQLSGMIPSEIGNLTNLNRLYLWGNCLGGKLPPTLVKLRKLKQLWLHGLRNRFRLPDSVDKSNFNNLQMTGSKQIRSFFSAVFLAEHAPAGATGHAAAGTSSETGAAAKEITPAAITSSTLDDLDKSIAAATESIAISAQSTEHSAMPSRKKTLLDLASEIMSGTDDTNERQQSDDTSWQTAANDIVKKRTETRESSAVVTSVTDTGRKPTTALADFLRQQASGEGPKVSLSDFLRQQQDSRNNLEAANSRSGAPTGTVSGGSAVRIVQSLRKQRLSPTHTREKLQGHAVPSSMSFLAQTPAKASRTRLHTTASHGK